MEHKDVPLAIRPPGGCDHLAVDFDGDPFMNGTPITQRVADMSDLSPSEREAIDMYYETCGIYATLSVRPGASVGLVRKTEDGAEVTPEQCAAAASAASIGGELHINKGAHAEGLASRSARPCAP
ncbi:hypothetical protein [Thermasporomyces composti]|uniref:hypothetical protein n=1 Tax=Thermasporomyces composti TaxID=696763 RepID=UPI0011C01CF3|nr:hypothetical protein [Thermasporomyces composti]